MIPYGTHYIDAEDKRAVLDVLDSNFLTCGPKIDEFEQKVASLIGARYAVAVNNGTSALHLAYLACGVKKGDEVITTPNTFAATANMLMAIGATPVLADIRSDTYNINEEKLESLINAKTKAIVPVHFAGHPCEMEIIWKIARKHKLAVIEDGAHALGAKYRGKHIGGGSSDMVTFSFHPVKPITTGEGGLVATNSRELYEKMKLIRSHGIFKDKNGFNVMVELGYNYRMTDIQAALGISQLKKLDHFLELRHQVASWYKTALSGITDIILPVELEDCYSGWHLYAIRTKNEKDRLPLYKHLLKSGIGVNFHYPPLYWHPYYKASGYDGVACPMAEQYGRTAITLPLHTRLKKKDIAFIATSIADFFNK